MVEQTQYTRSTTCDWTVVVAALLALLAFPASGVAQGAPAESEPLPATVPIFPLPDVTLLPNSTQPFHIFEPRYRAMVADALAGDSVIGMVVLQPGHEADYRGRPPVYAIGCAGVIVTAERLPDGRYDIVLRGLTKFTILHEDASRPYRLADVEELVEAVTDRDLLTSRRQQLEAAAARPSRGRRPHARTSPTRRSSTASRSRFPWRPPSGSSCSRRMVRWSARRSWCGSSGEGRRRREAHSIGSILSSAPSSSSVRT
jgi:Lon protease-like protein